MILDKYFKYPVFYDYLISTVLVLILFSINHKYCILPETMRSVSITSELSNVGFTSAGFILTILTVLITFKSGSTISKENYSEKDSLFDLFFASPLYLLTVRILKNAIKSLLLISILGYGLKSCLPEYTLKSLFFFNIFGLIVIGLSLWRCLLVLSKIIKMQE
jgi:hypothetical protein